MEDHFQTEKVYFDPPVPVSANSWWEHYAGGLLRISLTARASLECDCRYIVDRGIYGTGVPDPLDWPAERIRTGLVMGSVQSGKTASMLGVTALALDRGVDIVVILGGTRLSLWRQTYERVIEQLIPVEGQATRLLCPTSLSNVEDHTSPSQLYGVQPAAARRRLSRNRPLIFVAMKHSGHLFALGRSLRQNVFPAVEVLGRPVHMLVLDDEADDGSILDAVVEANEDPTYGNLKQIPRAIASLWSTEPRPDNLFTTYIGYTATPQANLLQLDHNPLAPRDFLVALRTPLDVGEPISESHDAPRTATYPEPDGLSAYYTGGQVFYNRGRAAGLCRETRSDPSENIADSVRAFLIAGAIRLFRSQGLGPVSAADRRFATKGEAAADVMPPHSMLIHPSAVIEDHFRVAEDLLLWAGEPDRGAARRLLETGDARLPEALTRSVEQEPAPWQQWLEDYVASARRIESEFNVRSPKEFPTWPEIKQLLVEEIIPGTRLAVINSDPNADDRPEFSPVLDPGSGEWMPARDLCTIFVSGNVMARGLTLEGLTTVLFERASSTPFADTQMQMQRWFGYRGPYIELCRVFASASQLRLFGDYHTLDEALRTAIAARMRGDAPHPAVLQGLGFLATGKIANLRNWPLAPGAKPFVSLVNDGGEADPNVALFAELFAREASADVVAGGRRVGRILERPLALAEAANLLDQLRYRDYHPGTDHELALQWAQVETLVDGARPLAEHGLYRAPAGSSPTAVRRDCPYTIPAYLRLWESCLSRNVEGLFVTGRPGERWSLANLRDKQAEQPRFWLGIRYGSGKLVDGECFEQLPFQIPRTQKSLTGGELATEWGSNDPDADATEFRGDAYFDYYHRGRPAPTRTNESWRPPGDDGQILLYFNQLPGQEFPAVAFGVCIPAGGPELFAATYSTGD